MTAKKDSVKSLTPKQEKFAQKYIETCNASEAYRQAYNCENMKPESIHVNACKLLSDTKVLQRVEELQAAARKKHEVTLESLTKEYDELKRISVDLEQMGAGVSALNGKAKIHGFDKSTIDLKLPKVIRKDLTGKK